MSHRDLELVNQYIALKKIKEYVYKKTPLTEHLILDINRTILDGIRVGGFYRKEQAFISGTNYEPPEATKIPFLMKEYIKQIESKSSLIGMPESEINVYSIAAYTHCEFVKIHPFAEGNGRTARTIMNYIFLSNNEPLVIIGSQENSKKNYYKALADYDLKKDIKPFISFLKNDSIKVNEFKRDSIADSIARASIKANSFNLNTNKDKNKDKDLER